MPGVVEVDPETGRVEIVRYSCVDDVGRVINPLIVHGQVHGGIAQGVGQALTEDMIFDPDHGQILTGSFMDYCLPRADDLPSFQLADNEVPATSNPLGVKGGGEGGTVPALAVVINAITDALYELGGARPAHAGNARAGMAGHPSGRRQLTRRSPVDRGGCVAPT